MDPPLPPRLTRNVDVGPQVLFRVGADPQFAEVFPPQRGRAHDGTDDRRDKVTEVLITEARRITVPTFPARSEEHTSELQSLMRISYAVFCLKKKKYIKNLTSRSTYISKHLDVVIPIVHTEPEQQQQ